MGTRPLDLERFSPVAFDLAHRPVRPCGDGVATWPWAKMGGKDWWEAVLTKVPKEVDCETDSCTTWYTQTLHGTAIYAYIDLKPPQCRHIYGIVYGIHGVSEIYNII